MSDFCPIIKRLQTVRDLLDKSNEVNFLKGLISGLVNTFVILGHPDEDLTRKRPLGYY